MAFPLKTISRVTAYFRDKILHNYSQQEGDRGKHLIRNEWDRGNNWYVLKNRHTKAKCHATLKARGKISQTSLRQYVQSIGERKLEIVTNECIYCIWINSVDGYHALIEQKVNWSMQKNKLCK